MVGISESRLYKIIIVVKHKLGRDSWDILQVRDYI